MPLEQYKKDFEDECNQIWEEFEILFRAECTRIFLKRKRDRDNQNFLNFFDRVEKQSKKNNIEIGYA